MTNEARVHLWYARRYGHPIPPYRSTEHAIATWPTTASGIGVRYDDEGRFVVCAPFGLSDLFAMVVRPDAAPAWTNTRHGTHVIPLEGSRDRRH